MERGAADGSAPFCVLLRVKKHPGQRYFGFFRMDCGSEQAKTGKLVHFARLQAVVDSSERRPALSEDQKQQLVAVGLDLPHPRSG